MLRACGVLLCVLITGFRLAADTDGANPESRADNIKAAFIYKFTGYISWPETGAETFTVAVLGRTTLLEPLRQIARDYKVGEKQLVIKTCARLEEINGAQILFIASDSASPLAPILKKAEAEKMLTVGSTPGFAEKGVAINFCVIENRIGFEMNLGSLKRAGLPVSSQLIKLARLVEDAGQTEDEGQPE